MADHTDDERIGSHGLRCYSSHLTLTTAIRDGDGHGEAFDGPLVINGHLDRVLIDRTQPTHCSRKVGHQAHMDGVTWWDDDLTPGISRNRGGLRRAGRRG